MHKIVNNTVQVPLNLLNDEKYKQIKVEKKGKKYAYLNIDEYEDFLSILQNTRFKKGDRVFWFKNGSSKIPLYINHETVNTNRIDEIIKVQMCFNAYSSILGNETTYLTKEINGNKRGKAYESYLIKVEDFNTLNGTNY